MDGVHFDNLTRQLTNAASRRALLKKALAAGLGGALLRFSPLHRQSAEAACRPAGRRCTGDGNCCSGLCDPSTKTCVCPQGTVECRGECRPESDFQSDPDNCGACGNRCPVPVPNGEAVCCRGFCDYECQDGYQLCGFRCLPNSAFPVVVTYPANRETFTDSGFTLETGASVTVTTTGMIDLDGPGGIPPNDPYGDFSTGLGGAQVRYGPNGSAANIGAQSFLFSFPNDPPAKLYFGIKDTPGAYADNTDSFTSTITCNVPASSCPANP